MDRGFGAKQVIVVTVTYNSSPFLKRLVEALEKSTVPIHRVIVVDNASNETHARNNLFLANEHPLIHLIQMKKNLGGAGGFRTGIDYILKEHMDFGWVWIMDDDAYPQEDCLEKLFEYADTDDAGCLCPVIFGVENNKYQLYHHKMESKYLNRDRMLCETFQELPEICRIESNAFVGPLIKRKVIEDVGTPDDSLFIYGDDLEFIYRISRRYNVLLIKNARINHRDPDLNDKYNPAEIWKNYYKYRNRYLFIAKYALNWQRKTIGMLLLTKQVVKDTVLTILRSAYRGYRRLRLFYMWKAVFDGVNAKTGKTVDPASF